MLYFLKEGSKEEQKVKKNNKEITQISKEKDFIH